MNSDILIGVVLGVAAGVIFYRFFNKKKSDDDFSALLDKKLPDAIKQAGEHLVQLVESEKKEIRSDLANKKSAIEDAVKRLLDEVKDSKKRVEEAEKERVGSFRELKQQLETQQKISEQLSVTTDGLRKVLSNNQLRGQFGEQVAEDLLKMTGFVKGVDYAANKSQKDQSRPDFTIFLPDGVKINVDVKFPYLNLQKAAESENEQTRVDFIKAFKQNVKEKIKQVTGREYINPQENTVDFCVMFIPNEMVFSYIYEHMNDVWSEAMKNKVVFAGPFSFTAILRLIRQSYDTFRYQKNVAKIISYIKNFEGEFKKYNLEFEKIGDRIGSLSQQYDLVNTTRSKQLMRTVDKIVLEETSAPLLESDISDGESKDN